MKQCLRKSFVPFLTLSLACACSDSSTDSAAQDLTSGSPATSTNSEGDSPPGSSPPSGESPSESDPEHSESPAPTPGNATPVPGGSEPGTSDAGPPQNPGGPAGADAGETTPSPTQNEAESECHPLGAEHTGFDLRVNGEDFADSEGLPVYVRTYEYDQEAGERRCVALATTLVEDGSFSVLLHGATLERDHVEVEMYIDSNDNDTCDDRIDFAVTDFLEVNSENEMLHTFTPDSRIRLFVPCYPWID